MNFYILLKRGITGNDVSELQEELKKLGLYDIEIDGSFGPATEKAVRKIGRASCRERVYI